MSRTAVHIGPGDHGRTMSLAEFESADCAEGHRYELSRGIVTVIDVPNPAHLAMVGAIRRQLAAYDLAHPGTIHTIASAGECKILVAELESERHPDLAVYLTSPPSQTSDVWASWVPEIVVEVVSPDSAHRDYEEKREEYLRFGVREYWLVDAVKGCLVAFVRNRGQWKESIVRPPELWRTALLPGWELDVAAVLAAKAT